MTRYALVPVEATEEMASALVEMPDAMEWSFQDDYARMLSASPNGGKITAEMLERAAGRLLERWNFTPMPTCREEVEIVVAELGLAIEDPTRERMAEK